MTPEGDKNRIARSLDELIVKTVGIVESLPERIERLEAYVRALEMDFSKHEGEQTQRFERLTEKIKDIEFAAKEVHCGFKTIIDEMRNDVQDIKQKRGMTRDELETFKGIEDTVEKLDRDYESRKETKDTFWKFISNLLNTISRYLVLPLVIWLFAIIGLGPKYNPWFKPIVNSNEFDKLGIELISYEVNGYINESTIRYFYRRNKELTILSEENSIKSAMNEINKNEKHFFIWLPKNNNDGFIRMYDVGGRKIGHEIKIIRGK